MKVANFCHVVFLLVLAGCANPRTFSGGGYSGGNSTFAPTPATGGTYGGSTLGPAEGDFSQRSSRPITPAPSSPARSSSPPVSTAPKQAPKGPTLGLPTAKSKSQTTASIGTPPLGAEIPDGGSAVRNTIGVPLVWNRRYQSTQRRPIETLVFGTGNRRIMVIGSMHGDEPQSVGLVEELALHLRSNPDELVDLKMLLVKSPNPDGLAGRTSTNSHNIDLNRNFPGQNWARTTDKLSGTKAGSELETQVMVRLTSEFRPNLVIHLKDSRDKGRVNAEGACEELAETFAKPFKFETLRNGGAKTSGSIENFVASKAQCPALTLLLPLEKDDPTAWRKYGPALLDVINPKGETVTSWRKTDSRQVADRSETQPKELPKMRIRTLDLRRDDVYVPEEPGAKQKNASNSVPDNGYYELPTPGQGADDE